jgi:hypothetical protein
LRRAPTIGFVVVVILVGIIIVVITTHPHDLSLMIFVVVIIIELPSRCLCGSVQGQTGASARDDVRNAVTPPTTATTAMTTTKE